VLDGGQTRAWVFANACASNEFAAVCTAYGITQGSINPADYYMGYHQKEIYNMSFTMNNVTSFSGKTFTLTYDPTALRIIDLCLFTYVNEATAGVIPRTGITITSVTPGSISFTIDKPVLPGYKWSGVVNIFKFEVLTSGNTAIPTPTIHE
jgi:hypothetical protein